MPAKLIPSVAGVHDERRVVFQVRLAGLDEPRPCAARLNSFSVEFRANSVHSVST